MISAFGVEHGQINKSFLSSTPTPKHRAEAPIRGKRKGYGRGKLALVKANTIAVKLQPHTPTSATAMKLGRAVVGLA